MTTVLKASKRKARVATASVVSNAALVLMKLVVGLLMGSVAVISESIHSAIDLVAAAIALYAVRTSSKPADEDHAFGHGKIEAISGAFEGALIFVAAGWIVVSAAGKLAHGTTLESPGLGMGVMLISAAANWFVSRALFRVGRETESLALEADAWHLRTDVWTSVGVMLALAAIWVFRLCAPTLNVLWLDPLAAILVALLIVKAAFDLVRKSLKDLMDTSLPESEVAWIREYFSSLPPEVKGFHDLKTRRSGSLRFIEVDLEVDPAMSVADSHEFVVLARKGIRERFPACDITVHMDPVSEEPQSRIG